MMIDPSLKEHQVGHQGLYVEDGHAIATHSMIKTMRRCPKQAHYKYVERLKPRVLGKPLRRGTWMHSLLEAYYKGEDWEAKHAELTTEFGMLFDEERDALGDLPRECKRLMKSYLWHYRNEVWTVHEVEVTLEAEFPDGSIYRGRIDLLVENEWGLWIVDHKTHKVLPRLDFRILDAQSALYVWAALKMDIPVTGFIWNYVRTKSPSIPQLTQSGRLSKRKIDTDYITYLAALKRYGLDPKDPEHARVLAGLKAQRYQHGAPQTSSFFRRDMLERNPAMLKQVAQEAYHTAKRMNEYPWDRPEIVERVPDRSCSFSCSYTDLCTTELFGGVSVALRNQRYEQGDPMDYYRDDKEPDKGDDN